MKPAARVQGQGVVPGEGPIDLLLGSGIGSHLDMYWEISAAARFFQGLASFSRLIMLDPRGVGLSEAMSTVPETRFVNVGVPDEWRIYAVGKRQ